MSEFNIEVEGGKAVRLPTAGKYCDRDIVVTATGGGSTMDDFWDSFLASLAFNPTSGDWDCQYAFAGRGWNGGCGKPNRTIQPRNATNMFNSSSLTDISDWDIDFSKCTAFTQMCYSSYLQKIGVVDARGAYSVANAFNYARKLVEIEKIILKDAGTQPLDALVENCISLKEVRFEGVIGKNIRFAQSSLLSVDSVQSIIDHLKDLTGATAQTLTLHATVGANLTQAQKDAVSAKNWTLVY